MDFLGTSFLNQDKTAVLSLMEKEGKVADVQAILDKYVL